MKNGFNFVANKDQKSCNFETGRHALDTLGSLPGVRCASVERSKGQLTADGALRTNTHNNT